MIKIKTVDFAYQRGKSIFDFLDLELTKGHIYGLLGKNGSGKSTLLKLISGVLRPTKGSIESMGSDPFDRKPSYISNIYYLNEEIYTPNSTMRRHAKMVGPFYPNFNFSDLERYMNEFELSLDTKLTKLSLGQKKKAAIAFALACNTQILLLDEPTNGLDIPSKSQFRRVIANATTDDKLILISTHQVRDLDSLIDSIVVIDNGQVIINADTYHISQRLKFCNLQAGDTAIYKESTLAGERGVVENCDQSESKIDIEMLFGAAVTNPEEIIRVLKK